MRLKQIGAGIIVTGIAFAANVARQGTWLDKYFLQSRLFASLSVLLSGLPAWRLRQWS
jgi:hypothetical protein